MRLQLEEEGMDNKKLKAKIKGLKDVYRQEIAKIKRSRKRGTGAADVYQPKLAWFPSAHFFQEVLSTRESQSNLVLPCGSKQTADTDNIRNSTMFSNIDGEELGDSRMMSPTPVRREKKRRFSEIDEAIEQLGKIAQQTVEDRPYEAFGKHVAAELRGLPQREAFLLEQEIQNSITRAKLRSLDCLDSGAMHFVDSMSSSYDADGADDMNELITSVRSQM